MTESQKLKRFALHETAPEDCARDEEPDSGNHAYDKNRRLVR